MAVSTAALMGLAAAGCSLLTGQAERPQSVESKGGASQSTRPTSAPATSEGVSQLGYDPAKALLPIETIFPVDRLPEPTEKPDRAIPPQAIKHYMVARDLFGQWMNAETIAELEQAIRYDPGSFDCHLLLGRAAMRSGNLGLARNHLREAVKLRPEDVTGQYLLGALAVMGDDLAEATRRFRMALMCGNADPDRAETILAHAGLGEVLIKQGYLSAGIDELEAFEDAISDPQGQFWRDRDLLKLVRTQRTMPLLMIGRAALILHRYDQAKEAFERALEYEPGDLKIRVRYAQALARTKECDKALAIARELALDQRTMKAGIELLGWIYNDSGRPEGITEELRGLLAKHPDRAELGVVLANALLQFGRQDQAISVLRHLVKNSPKMAAAYVRLAAILVDQDRITEAVGVLADAIAAGPETHVGVLRAIAQIGGKTETARKVVGLADKLATGDEKNHAMAYVLGLICAHADRPALAVKWLDRAIELKQDFLPAYLSLGRLHLARFEWQKAIDVARRAEKVGEKTPAMTYLLAQAYDGLDEIDAAVAAYQYVIEKEPKSVPALVALGQLYERTGQRNKAQQEYQRALKVAPNNDEAGERLIRLLLGEGEAADAQRVLRDFRSAGGGRNVLGRCLAVMASRGSMERYRQLLGKLIEQAPKDVETRYDLAVGYYTSRDYAEADKEVNRILEIEPGHQKARFLMAELCRKRLDPASGVKILRGLLTEHPNREVWLLALAEMYLDLQGFDDAAKIFDRLIARSKDVGRRGAYRLRLIGIYGAARQYDKAVEVAEQWLKDDPKSRTARRLLIEALHEAKRDDQAVRAAEAWVAEGEPKTVAKEGQEEGRREREHEQRSLLISTYVATKRYDQAAETLLGWMEEDPTNRSLRRQLWLALSNAKRYDDAVELCMNAIAVERNPQVYQIMLAQTYLEAGRFDDALAVLKGLPDSDDNEIARRLEIMTLMRAKRYDRAEEVAKKTASRTRQDDIKLGMTRLLVLIYQRQGRMDESIKELEKIFSKDPKEPGINNDLGYTYAESGRKLAQAERMVGYALGEEPRNSAYMDSYGWVLYKKGDFQGAAGWLAKATRGQGGDDAVIYEHLGDAYWRLGKKDAAKRSWVKAVELAQKEQDQEKDPSDPETLPRVRKRLDQLEQGGTPQVSEVVGPPPSTNVSGRVEGRPVEAPANR